MKKLLLPLLILTVVVAPLALLAGAVQPAIPAAARGEQCVEPVDDMRRNHMNYILHQRDETMHKGIRTRQHSLVECINCHVGPGDNGQYPVFGSDQHFCSSCHNYAAVNIDCFQCHATKPADAKVSGEVRHDQ